MRVSIDSILNQTFTDFELIIADNASTDDTQEICEEYASKDSRIRYYRNAENMGVTWNFNYTFELARGKYFKWMSHDDYIYPNFLEVCLKGLQNREGDGYVSCWPNTEIIDEDGKIDHKVIEPEMRLESDIVSQRFRDAGYLVHSSFQFYGIFNSEALAKTCLLGQWISSDYTMLGQLALIGKSYQHPDVLFQRRQHDENSYESCGKDYYRYAHFWVPIEKKEAIILPYWRMAFEAFKGVMRFPMPFVERLKCLFYVATCRQAHRGRSQYFWDVTNALYLFIKRLSGKRISDNVSQM